MKWAGQLSATYDGCKLFKIIRYKVSQNKISKLLTEKKIVTKIVFCGAKFPNGLGGF